MFMSKAFGSVLTEAFSSTSRDVVSRITYGPYATTSLPDLLTPHQSPLSYCKLEPTTRLIAAMAAKRRSKVSFVPHVSVRNIPDTSDYSDEEYENSWYFRDDLEHFKTEVKLTVKLMEVGNLPVDTIEFCRRGLEFRTNDGMQARMRNKVVARNTLFDEQEAQWNRGFHDPESLAAIYAKVTKHCLDEARYLAVRDEHEARDPYDLPHAGSKSGERFECATVAISKTVRPRRHSLYSAAA